MIATPALFSFDKATGKILVNADACTHYTPRKNNFSTVAELVSNTIKVFNLNCDRLVENRLKVFYSYQQKIKWLVFRKIIELT